MVVSAAIPLKYLEEMKSGTETRGIFIGTYENDSIFVEEKMSLPLRVYDSWLSKCISPFFERLKMKAEIEKGERYIRQKNSEGTMVGLIEYRSDMNCSSGNRIVSRNERTPLVLLAYQEGTDDFRAVDESGNCIFITAVDNCGNAVQITSDMTPVEQGLHIIRKSNEYGINFDLSERNAKCASFPCLY